MDKDILFFDVETDSRNADKANMKFFGAFSTKYNKYFIIETANGENDENIFSQIQSLISDHRVLVGFNSKKFDQPVTEKFQVDFRDNRVHIDLNEISAPWGKGRLPQMGIILESYSLKIICDHLKLDKDSKGEIDYNIFKKDKWSDEEIVEIKKYVKQDINLTIKLFEWYEKMYEPLKNMLSIKQKERYVHLTATHASLSYQILCNRTGKKIEWESDEEEDLRKIELESLRKLGEPNPNQIEGGHHIDARKNIIKGNIIEVDFNSAYPHAIMMCNLFSPTTKGWDGNKFYEVKGVYDNKKLGDTESVLKELYEERLKAKKNNDEAKNLSYKLVCNAPYGFSGNPIYKSYYNPTAANDCTSIVRTWLKKLAQTVEKNGFFCIYGFTDSIFIEIPKGLTKTQLMIVFDRFTKSIKKSVPFPMDTFGMDVEEEIKFMWIVAKNCYLFVTNDNEVKYKQTLLNKNTPKVTMNVFDEYIKPKIIKELNIKFSEVELIKQLKLRFKDDPELTAEKFNVNSKETYKSKTCKEYQISEAYGEGTHYLIPNTKGIGIGRSKSTKKKVAVRKCTIKEFLDNELNVEDIEISNLIQPLEPFITKPNKIKIK